MVIISGVPIFRIFTVSSSGFHYPFTTIVSNNSVSHVLQELLNSSNCLFVIIHKVDIFSLF